VVGSRAGRLRSSAKRLLVSIPTREYGHLRRVPQITHSLPMTAAVASYRSKKPALPPLLARAANPAVGRLAKRNGRYDTLLNIDIELVDSCGPPDATIIES